MDNILKLPLVALRGLVMFPNSVLSFEVSSEKLAETIEKATEQSKQIFLTAPLNPEISDASDRNLYSTGTISEIKKILKLPGDNVRIIAQGLQRAKIAGYIENGKYVEVEVVPIEVTVDDSGSNEAAALVRTAKDIFEQYAALSPKIPAEITLYLANVENPAEVSDIIASNLPLKFEEKQTLLEIFDVTELLNREVEILMKEITILEIQKDILVKVKKNIDQSQREYQLREQMKVLQDELGEKGSVTEEIADYEKRMEAFQLPAHVTEKLDKELSRLKRISSHSQEGVVIRDYIDWVLDIPWSEKSETSPSLAKAEAILDEDHYGLVKVKERIVEYLAARQNTERLDSPILCLVGPPGVGKTSIAKSVAKALNRKYIRMSLGGVRDEAEIRGHRKTYIGAMPGRIIHSMKQAGVTNPLILLDEIDKLSSDYKGDPASALLEVLDQEQNFSFRDHYIELSYDLSDVFFICTANSVERIPAALRDRLEIIELHSYTLNEKENIAAQFLVKKQMEKHGLHFGILQIEKSAITDIIQYYTREAGVRQLERRIARLCRKAVRLSLSGADTPLFVNSSNVSKYLGSRKYKKDKINRAPEIGVVCGMAWTSAGGDILLIEVNCLKGSGKLKLTGNIGKVMKESANAGYSYIRAEAPCLGIEPDFYKNTDLHIHIPEGATPKDGPSAGITMATAMISALSKKAVRNDTAMTGEITLRGKVLPIGGLKEKILAAKTAGIKKVLIPYDNEGDLHDIEEEILQGLHIVLAENMAQVINHAIMD